MSKLPVLDSLKQHHKKIQRLYFPKYGDPSLYVNCGRKHYAQSSIFSLPYASFDQQEFFNQRNQQRIHFLNKKLNMEQNFQYRALHKPQTQQHSNKSYERETYQPSNIQARQPPKQHTYNTYDQLDKYQNYKLPFIENQRQKNGYSRQRQFPLYNRAKEEPMRTSRYNKVKMRVKTEAEGESTQIRLQSNENKKRVKTELNQPGQVKNLLKQPRFNPTFLSSLNY